LRRSVEPGVGGVLQGDAGVVDMGEGVDLAERHIGDLGLEARTVRTTIGRSPIRRIVRSPGGKILDRRNDGVLIAVGEVGSERRQMVAQIAADESAAGVQIQLFVDVGRMR